MGAYPLCRLTTAPDWTAPVLFDFQEGYGDGTWINQGLSFGEPSWSTGSAGIVEGTRTITLPLRIDGNRGERGSRLLKLSQALLRPHRSVYLQWQEAADSPATWFRLHQASQTELDISRTYVDPGMRSTYVVPVQVVADGWGIGQRVDLPEVTMPAEQLQQGIELPRIAGSAPAPLVLDLLPSHPWGRWQQLVNTTAVHYDAAYAGTQFWKGDLFTPRSGASKNGRSIQWDEPLGNTAEGRALATLAAPPTYLSPGTYRVLILARHQMNDKGGGWFKAGLGGHTGFSTSVTTPWAPWAPAPGSANDQCWVDCGVITVPGGGVRVETMDDKAFTQPELQVKWRWNKVDDEYANAYLFDGMVMVPAGPMAGMAGMPTNFMPRWDKFGPDPSWIGRIDAEEKRVSMVSTLSGADGNFPGATPQGGWPRVVPDARNYVTVLNRINPSSPTSGTNLYEYSVRVGGWYHPRFLHTAATE